jgi:parvulin-like peptidyl-prolyl isomerase
MKWKLAAIGVLVGVVAGSFLLGSFSFRRALGGWSHRGELLALVEGAGIYRSDVEQGVEAKRFSLGSDADEASAPEERDVFAALVGELRLRAAAAKIKIPAARIDESAALFRHEFGDEKRFASELDRSGKSARALHRDAAIHEKECAWIERKISKQLGLAENEARTFYDDHLQNFQQPPRWRVNHLFLAAPAGSPAELLRAKRNLIEALSKRIRAGENFAQLVSEFSEDEASKKHGGDLHYFSRERMLPEISAAAEKLRMGEISDPVSSRLGFHLLQLTSFVPARQMSFDEARSEIMAHLANEKRRSAVANALRQLSEPALAINSPR